MRLKFSKWPLLVLFSLLYGFGMVALDRQVTQDFHDDGEPVVRAYVCENGHVSGAWTNLPLYT